MRLIKTFEQRSTQGRVTSLEIAVNYDHVEKVVKSVSHVVAIDNDTKQEIDISYIITEWFENIIDSIDWWEVYSETR